MDHRGRIENVEIAIDTRKETPRETERDRVGERERERARDTHTQKQGR